MKATTDGGCLVVLFVGQGMCKGDDEGVGPAVKEGGVGVDYFSIC